MNVFSNCIKTMYWTNFYWWAMDVELIATTRSIIFRILQYPEQVTSTIFQLNSKKQVGITLSRWNTLTPFSHMVKQAIPVHSYSCKYMNGLIGNLPGCYTSWWSSLLVSQLKCGNLCECTPIQGNFKILKIIDYVVARNSTCIAHM